MARRRGGSGFAVVAALLLPTSGLTMARFGPRRLGKSQEEFAPRRTCKLGLQVGVLAATLPACASTFSRCSSSAVTPP